MLDAKYYCCALCFTMSANNNYRTVQMAQQLRPPISAPASLNGRVVRGRREGNLPAPRCEDRARIRFIRVETPFSTADGLAVFGTRLPPGSKF